MKQDPQVLKELQNLPLDYKILITKQRIEDWYRAWTKFTITDKATGKTRFATIDADDFMYSEAKDRFKMKDSEEIYDVEPGQVYVSFSGGKDSTVLKHIVDSMYDNVPALFVNTGLEYPEIQKFAMSQPNVIAVRPEMRFDEVIKNFGYPVVSKEVAQIVREAKIGMSRGDGSYEFRIKKLRGELLDKNGNLSQFNVPQWGFLLDAPFDISEQCCTIMKKTPLKRYEKETGRKPIVGTMATESRLRQQRWLRYGCNSFDSQRPSSNPMSFWTEQDVLLYLKRFDVPYCSVYGDIVVRDDDGNEYTVTHEQLQAFSGTGCLPDLCTTGCNRTGCIFCMFGCHLEKEQNRFQRLKETHTRQYEYCIGGGEMVDGKWQPNKQGLGLGHVLDYIGVPYR